MVGLISSQTGDWNLAHICRAMAANSEPKRPSGATLAGVACSPRRLSSKLGCVFSWPRRLPMVGASKWKALR